MMPTAIVIDRTTAKRRPKSLAQCMTELGGAWPQMYAMWCEARRKPCYCILLAHTTERLRQRAPLAFMLRDEDALRRTLQHLCYDLMGLRVRWLLLLDQESDAYALAQTELLLDFAPEGNA